jgi:hypothetical protein
MNHNYYSYILYSFMISPYSPQPPVAPHNRLPWNGPLGHWAEVSSREGLLRMLGDGSSARDSLLPLAWTLGLWGGFDWIMGYNMIILDRK